ncbi:MAG: TldD/PmbA family protein [Planctomycetota bacterium]
MLERLEASFRRTCPTVEHASLRWHREARDVAHVRNDVVEPWARGDASGVLVTVRDRGGAGYAATSDLSDAGLEGAFRRARQWADRTRGRSIQAEVPLPSPVQGSYVGPAEQPFSAVAPKEVLDRLRRACAEMAIDDAIVDRHASVEHVDVETLLVDSAGMRVHQQYEVTIPFAVAVAHAAGESQVRTLGGRGHARQGGVEVLERILPPGRARRVAEEAVELLAATMCPEATCDVVLAPDQMILQIHESIGHPLELDRILGDERNYAGTSFVTLDMFGSYRYGSDLLDVTFDPGVPGQVASYAYDDDGTPATREWLIRKGILERGLGGAASQARSGVPGVANARACAWNRPPIDRMANLNLEPGTSRFEDLVGAVENGVYMETNCSWSIDDARNKFQFGCELGRRIRDGELAELVRKPNYRGISATFWRNLAGVGDASTREVLGTPNCGKGEPNQMVRVGHASPACRFRDVAVFGGA